MIRASEGSLNDPAADTAESANPLALTPIQEFYSGFADVQWTRFDRHARVEEYVLHKTFETSLPSAPADVMDIGGGNGRHAFFLASAGYRVSLCDITEYLVDDARRRDTEAGQALQCIELCDARDLPWPTECADAVLLLGPLYCLTDRNERAAVLREALRVLKPGGTLIAQFISRIGALRQLIELGQAGGGIIDWRGFLLDGVFSSARVPQFFQLHYFTTAGEAIDELHAAGLHDVSIRGMDGPASLVGQRALAEAPSRIVRQWGEVAYAIGTDPEYRSTSNHLLAVAHK
jgi:ubiquinone/menaquinone biosynthesis C-methylase UbiE